MLTSDEVADLNKALDAYARELVDHTTHIKTLKIALVRESEEYKRNKHKYKVLEVCRALHMLVTGALDGITQQEAAKMATWLEYRITFWEPSTNFPNYDRAVFQLATETLAEWNRTH